MSRTGRTDPVRFPFGCRRCVAGSSRPARSRARGGFTLIELLVSVVILSTGIVVVLGAFQMSLSALAAARESVNSGILLRQAMADAELALREAGGTIGSGSGAFDEEFKDYRWRRDVRTQAVIRPGDGQRLGNNVDVALLVWRDGSRARASATQLFFVKEPDT
jgi:prepilin-type N-terminal cleavage/methylation domain-containing protein